jgi:hypothetical protein
MGGRCRIASGTAYGYTLLRLGGTGADTSPLQQAFDGIGAPLQVLDVRDERARDVYGFDLLLLRPDMHVVWRGNDAPGSRLSWRRLRPDTDQSTRLTDG